MPATELLCQIIGVKHHLLSKEEHLILEAELFTQICEELQNIFKSKYSNYFQLIKCSAEMENAMIESIFVRSIINDILSTKEYTLSGIAYYTQIPEEIVYEIAMGLNTSPSAIFLRKIIELHRSVRRDLYRDIVKKITANYLETE